MAHEILIIGDEWDTLDHPRDSSLYLCRVARQEFGLKTYWALAKDIFRDMGVLKVKLNGELGENGLTPIKNDTRALLSFESIHWRVDPPVDLSTMRLWSLLASTVAANRVKLVNSPEALLKWNEKFAPVAFLEYAIVGLVADTEEAWKSFYEKHSAKKLIAKPTGEAASRGVQFLPTNWPEALETLRQMRRAHGPWLVVQEFQPEILTKGETRIFIVAGAVVAAMNKRPKPDHLIMNLDLPPEARPDLKLCEPTDAQRARATEVATTLAADGVYLATIDFIGDRILEINVTSPGLIAWVDERLPANERIALKYWRGLTD